MRQTTHDGFVQAWESLEKVEGSIVKFSEMNHSFAFRIFLKPKRLPVHTQIQDRRRWAEHPDHFNTEYFPYVYWSGNGEGPRILQPLDRYGRFRISAPEYPSLVEKDYQFQISKRLYEMREFVEVDEGFDRRFLFSEETGKDIFQSLRYWISYHVDIADWAVSLIALWIMTTYYYEAFFAFPYLRLNAERGSGKSQVLKIISMCSAMGQFIQSPSGASIFRGVDALHCVLAIDEAESLSDQDQQELISHLNTGYEYGTAVWRINTNDMSLDQFQTYAPKAFGAINQMSPVLESRCLRIPIMRSINAALYSKRNPFTVKDVFAEIQENILFWSIKNGPSFIKTISDSDLDKYNPFFEGLPPRVHQLMAPLLYMYDFLDLDNPRSELGEQSERENLIQIIEYQKTQHKATSVNDADQRILMALYDCVLSGIPYVGSRDIIDHLQLDTEDEGKYYTPHKIGKVLVKYDIESRSIHGKKEYMPKGSITEKKCELEDIFNRYSIDYTDFSISGQKQETLGEEE